MAEIELVEYHVVNGKSRLDETVGWYGEEMLENAVAEAKEIGGTVFKVTSYQKDYEQVGECDD